ncbi:unnamed protein product, partial [Allacma fusca]
MKNLGRKSNLGEDLIVKVILRKMDTETRREFKKSLPDTNVPSLDTLIKFVNKVVADHATEVEIEPTATAPGAKVPKQGERNPQTLTASSNSDLHTILATAMVQVTNKYNQPWDCRALIDSGSTHTYITSALVTTLGLKRLELNSPMNVKGLSDTDVANISHTVELEITTTYSPDTVIRATALIVKKASGVHPRMPINPKGWTHLQQLNLADPAFHKSRSVDILFGADIYPRLIHGTIIRGNDNQPIAQESVFGWTVLGPTITTPGNVSVCYNSICPLDSTLRKFWEIED